MFEVVFILPRNDAGEVPTFRLDVSAVPPVGAFIEDEICGFKGYVEGVTYFRPVAGYRMEIQVYLR